MPGINVVVFDKTGTLTRGEFGVTEVVPSEEETEASVLRLAAAIEHDSEHPLAQGILRVARERHITVPAAEGLQAIAGKGVTARLEGRELFVGGPALLMHLGLTPPPVLVLVGDRAAAAGRAALYLCARRIVFLAWSSWRMSSGPIPWKRFAPSSRKVSKWPCSPETHGLWQRPWRLNLASIAYWPRCFRNTNRRKSKSYSTLENGSRWLAMA